MAGYSFLKGRNDRLRYIGRIKIDAFRGIRNKDALGVRVIRHKYVSEALAIGATPLT